MRELDAVLAAWSDARQRNEAAVLATVVDVKGSAYRRPGARMLITADGRRTGSISGGCLEGDVSKKAWWWTESGQPVVRTYDTTSDEDAVWEFGLGCNGVVRVLLERLGGPACDPLIHFLEACRDSKQAGVLATSLTGQVGQRLFLYPDGLVRSELGGASNEALSEAQRALTESKSRFFHTDSSEFFIEVVAPPVPLLIFGNGRDTTPVIRIAEELGWRAVPATSSTVLDDPRNVAVVMNHNYPQDRDALAVLIQAEIRYIGVLGPRARTEKMLADLGVEDWPANLYAPVGLDIGAETPETIALSIVAEIQAALTGRPGNRLRERSGPIYSRSELAIV